MMSDSREKSNLRPTPVRPRLTRKKTRGNLSGELSPVPQALTRWKAGFPALTRLTASGGSHAKTSKTLGVLRENAISTSLRTGIHLVFCESSSCGNLMFPSERCNAQFSVKSISGQFLRQSAIRIWRKMILGQILSQIPFRIWPKFHFGQNLQANNLP